MVVSCIAHLAFHCGQLAFILAFALDAAYSQEPISPSIPVSCDLYEQLDWSPEALARVVARQVQSGSVDREKIFLQIVDAIRAKNEVPHDYKAVSQLLISVCPEDTATLVNSLSYDVGPGHAYTNLTIAQLLVDQELTLRQQERLCRALSRIYVDSRERGLHVIAAPAPSLSPSELAANGLVALTDLGRLSDGSFRALLGVLKSHRRTNMGTWLARFLNREMPREVAISNLKTIVDILEDPPHDDSISSCVDLNAYARLSYVCAPTLRMIDTDEICHGNAALLQPREEQFAQWCNQACDPTWPRSTADAMRLLIVRTGEAGLSVLGERLADSSKSDQTRLRLLACAAEIAPRSEQLKQCLLEILRTSKNPDWMLASEVARSLQIDEEYSSQLQSVSAEWHEYEWGYEEASYRFLSAIGATNEGMRLLEASFPHIDKMEASPPFYVFFLEDVPYAAERYERVLVRLLKAKTWWHRCAAVVMLHRYTDYFTKHPELLESIAERDQEPFVRTICRQVLILVLGVRAPLDVSDTRRMFFNV